MKECIVVSSDHAGFELKESIKGFLEKLGWQVDDVGTYSTEPVDYPFYTHKAALKVANGECPRGIICCGTGQGDAIVANKVPDIRAALCWNTFTAKLSRSHNDANMLVLGGWMTGKRLAKEMVRVWLETPFDGGRHQRRLGQMKAFETESALRRRKLYDISLIIQPNMITYPGDTPVSIEAVKSIAHGDSSNLSLLRIGTHSGTHVDAPSHFLSDAPGIDISSPEILMGPARLFQLPDVSHIDCKVLEELDLSGTSRLLLGTSNSTLLKKKVFDPSFIHLTEDAASYIAAQGIKLVGIDYLSIEGFKQEGHPVHRTLLSAGVLVIEGLDLTDVPPGDYELIGLPLRLKDGDAAPARVFLREV
jgi:arylformamidase